MNQKIIETDKKTNFKIDLLSAFTHVNAKDINITFFHDNTKEEIVSHGTMQGYIIQNYSNYFFNFATSDNVLSLGQMSTFLYQSWTSYMDTYNDNFWKMYNALITDYEPLNNYDKNSIITTEFFGKENDITEFIGKEKNTINFIGSEKNKNIKTGKLTQDNPQIVSVNSIANEESNDFYSKDKNTVSANTITTNYNSITDDNTTSFDNRENNETKSFENRIDKNTKDFDQRKDIVTEKTIGNIGVTTSQEMLESEMILRIKWNFMKFVIDNFVYLTCTPE